MGQTQAVTSEKCTRPVKQRLCDARYVTTKYKPCMLHITFALNGLFTVSGLFTVFEDFRATRCSCCLSILTLSLKLTSLPGSRETFSSPILTTSLAQAELRHLLAPGNSCHALFRWQQATAADSQRCSWLLYKDFGRFQGMDCA